MTAKSIIVFYDGLCGLCNGSVRFLLPRDKHRRLKFAPLQGGFAAKSLQGKMLPDSIVVMTQEGKVFVKSGAILAIAALLPMPWKFLGRCAGLIPLPLRDHIYDFVARHRRKFFGRHDRCQLPRPEWRGRFLNDQGV